RVIAAGTGKLGAKPAVAAVAPVAVVPVVTAPVVTAPVVTAPVVTVPVAIAPVAAAPVVVAPVVVAAVEAPLPVPPVAPASPAAASPKAAAAAESFQQIRATIDALGAPGEGTLDKTGNTVVAPGINALRAAEASGARALSSKEALALLEQPPREHAPPAATPASAAAPARRIGASKAQPVAVSPSASAGQPIYAVQLLWSVQAIDMSRVPQLAIFSAYRLYGAEGNRDGRRWYGLRLGFFADSVSAQQVANYVRSEFASVSVVPVSAGERERATRSTARPLPATKNEERSHGMQFIDEVLTDTATSGSRPALDEAAVAAAQSPADAEAAWAAAASAAVQGGPAPRKSAAPGKRAKLRAGNRAASKHPQRTPPQTLEQTLDALGASTLSLDEGRGDHMQFESTVGRTSAQALPPNRFGKLLDRLTKRFGSV
ncbi:MAG: hypothetical protein RL684_2691, partial [Pseudomonadota bacterium]